jgi:hypothetical protein
VDRRGGHLSLSAKTKTNGEHSLNTADAFSDARDTSLSGFSRAGTSPALPPHRKTPRDGQWRIDIFIESHNPSTRV